MPVAREDVKTTYQCKLCLLKAFAADGSTRALDRATLEELQWVAAFFCSNCHLCIRACYRLEFENGGCFFIYKSRLADFIEMLESKDHLMLDFRARSKSMNATIRSISEGCTHLRFMSVDAAERVEWRRVSNRMVLWEQVSESKSPYKSVISQTSKNAKNKHVSKINL